MSETPDWMKGEARRVAEDVYELVRRHELEDHDGEPCTVQRLGLLAYIAHVIGIRASGPTLLELAGMMREYEQDHAEHDASLN